MEAIIIQQKIFEIRGEKVMLDFDLAILFNVETKVLNQSVKRNIDRFPVDFMFQLSQREYDNWKSPTISNSRIFTRHSIILSIRNRKKKISAKDKGLVLQDKSLTLHFVNSNGTTP